MKKRASTKKLAARKPVTAPAADKRPTSAPESRPPDRTAMAPRAQAEVEKAKYTPAPLKTDGWPAFRYPLS